jgi:CubicO group peptidase (beta-lactamase class C family)
MATRAVKTADPLQGFPEFVQQTMAAWKVPGVAVGIVKDGKMIFAQGFGLRDVDRNLPVTADTVYALASVSKAFTALSVGILVDEGKLGWDQPVREYMPDFRLQDPFASERVTIRDMLCHRTGVPRHEGLRANAALCREDFYHRLAHLEPSRDLRTTFQYNNMMYISVGHIVAQLAGVEWEQVVQKRILNVLGMKATWVGVPDLSRLDNYAQQYRMEKDKFVAFPYGRRTPATCPCGGIYSNVVDMSKWLAFHLGDGSWKGKRIVSRGTLDELHTPNIVIRGGESIPGMSKYTEVGQQMYALGWFVEQYRGHRLIHHGGGVEGISTIATFMPDDGIGVVVLTNTSNGVVPTIVSYNVYERLLGLDQTNWNERLGAIMGEVMKGMAASKKAQAEARKSDAQPSRPLEAFEGEYFHPAYDTLAFHVEGGELKGRFATTELKLKHHHYDTFDVTIDLFSGMESQATFYFGPDGLAESVAMPIEPLVAPIVFRRSPPAAMRDSAFLEPFIGTYELLGMQLEVFRSASGSLVATVPGEGNKVLVPDHGSTFWFRDLPGYTIEFRSDASGKVTEAQLKTLMGTIPAKRI